MSNLAAFLIFFGVVITVEGFLNHGTATNPIKHSMNHTRNNCSIKNITCINGTKVTRELAMQRIKEVRAILRGERPMGSPKCKNTTITVEKCTCNCTCTLEFGNCTLWNGTKSSGEHCSCNATDKGSITKPTDPIDVVVTKEKPKCKNETLTLDRCTCNCTCSGTTGNCTLMNGTKSSGENCSCNATVANKPKPTEPLDVAVFFVDMVKHILGVRLAGSCYLQELPVEDRHKLFGIGGVKELELNLVKLITTQTTFHKKISQDDVKSFGGDIADKCADYITYKVPSNLLAFSKCAKYQSWLRIEI